MSAMCQERSIVLLGWGKRVCAQERPTGLEPVPFGGTKQTRLGQPRPLRHFAPHRSSAALSHTGSIVLTELAADGEEARDNANRYTSAVLSHAASAAQQLIRPLFLLVRKRALKALGWWLEGFQALKSGFCHRDAGVDMLVGGAVRVAGGKARSG